MKNCVYAVRLCLTLGLLSSTLLRPSPAFSVGFSCGLLSALTRHPFALIGDKTFDFKRFNDFKVDLVATGKVKGPLRSPEEVLAAAEYYINLEHNDGLADLNNVLAKDIAELSVADRLRRNLLINYARDLTPKSRLAINFGWPPLRWKVHEPLNALTLRGLAGLIAQLNLYNGLARKDYKTLREQFGRDVLPSNVIQRVIRSTGKANLVQLANDLGLGGPSVKQKIDQFATRHANVLAITAATSIHLIYTFALYKILGPTWWMLLPAAVPPINLVRDLRIERKFQQAYRQGGFNFALKVVHNRIEKLADANGIVDLTRAQRAGLLQSASDRATWLYGTLMSGLLVALAVELTPVLKNAIGFAMVDEDAKAAAQAQMSDSEIKVLLDTVWWESFVAFHGEPSKEDIQYAYELIPQMPQKTDEELINSYLAAEDESPKAVFVRAFLREYYFRNYVQKDAQLRVQY